MTSKKPLRSKLASSVSRSAAALSRATGRGDGSVIGGKIGLMIDPNLLANLAAGRQIALISGTNGKTTTTRLTAAALGVLGDVATNSFGANMPTGHTSALARAGNTPYAVLEVDEHYLPQVINSTSPHVVALLNLSRDQLDRAKEVAMMAQLWRDTLAKNPVHVVANADDPMITWAANAALEAGADITWVAAGQRWHDDSWVCPQCGSHIDRDQDHDQGGTEHPPTPVAPPVPVAANGAASHPVVDATVLMPAVSVTAPLMAEAPQSTVQPQGIVAPRETTDPTSTTGPTSTTDPTSTTGPTSSSTKLLEPAAIVASDGPGEPAAILTPISAVEPSSAVTPAQTIGPTSDIVNTPAEATVLIDIALTEEALAAVARADAASSSDDWRCTGCSLRRPTPSWRVEGDAVVDPHGIHHAVALALPGRVNRANAATALAVASLFGVDPAAAAPRLSSVASIAGRYAQVDRDGRNIRLLLAKNPAGWLEAFDMAEDAPTLLSINSRDPDGLDTSWLFDVDFSALDGRTVMITGDRAYDLAVRLEINDVPFTHVRTFGEAIAAVPPGRLEVIANYTAFQDIRAELDRVN